MDRNSTDSEGTKMLRLTNKQGLLRLTAELRSLDSASSPSSKARVGILAMQGQRFPPIDDVVAALDRIASRNNAS